MHTLLAFCCGLLSARANLTTVSEALEKLSNPLKVTIEAAPNLRSQLIYVEPRGSAPEITLQAIAEALSASIVTEQDGRKILKRTKADLVTLANRSMEMRQEWLEKHFEEVSRFSRRPPEKSLNDAFLESAVAEYNAKNMRLKGKLPLQTPNPPTDLLPPKFLLEAVVRRIGLREIASIPPETTRIYEDRPNSMSTKLPVHEVLDQEYIRRMNALDLASLGKRYRETAASTDKTLEQLTFGLGPAPASLSLRLQVYANFNAIDIRLEIYDPLQKRVGYGRAGVLPGPPMSMEMSVAREALKPDSVWVPISPEAAASAKPARPGTLADFPTWYFNPEKEEPLALFAIEGIRALAAQEKRCVVVDLSDSMWANVQASIRENRLNVNALASIMSRWEPYERVDKGQFVVWRPREQLAVESRQANRRVLANFARKFKQSLSPSLRDLSVLYHNGGKRDSWLTTEWDSMTFRTAASRPFIGIVPTRLYAILGGLSDPDWDDLSRGTVRSASSLGIVSPLKEYLLHDLLLRGVQSKEPLSDLNRHPSEHFSQGSVADTRLSLRQEPTEMVRYWKRGDLPKSIGWTSDGKRQLSFGLPASAFNFVGPRRVVALKREDFEARQDSYWFQYGHQDNLFIDLTLPTGGVMTELFPGTVQEDTPAIRYADLPQSFRDQTWQLALKHAEEEAQGINSMLPKKFGGG